MSTTRTFTRDEVGFQILMGSLVGHVTDPDGPLVLAVLDGECIGVASVDVHDALKADTGVSSDEELSAWAAEQDPTYTGIEFVHLEADPNPPSWDDEDEDW
jgi:hypothetical protein